MEFRAFFDSVPLGVCIARRDRRTQEVLYVNTALQKLIPTAKSGLPLQDVLIGDDTDTLIKKLISPTPPTDYTLPLSNGRWVKLTIAESNFENQEAWVLWVTDISASKEAEDRLRLAVAQADEAATVKANFLATMSHEIRTPMQTVYAILELIGEEKPEAKIRSMIDIARTSASGLLEILDDILDMAKIDANKMELDTFEVPVRTLVRGINEALSVKTIDKNIALKDDIAQDVPFVVIGDPKRLRQILMNLAGNALKFTAEGSVTIRVSKNVSVIPAPQKGVALRFEVIDTGIGMSEAVSKKLFQPFTQADSSTSRKFGGTGLGLSICRKLVELMGGQIGVTSVEGEGSIFWFEIPTEEVSTETTSVNLPHLDGISVLSVEDHPQGAKEIVRSLESMGAKVDSCPTIKEGLALVKRRPFDVAIIDQGLPDGLGIDLIREAMDIRPYMGLVMYTVRDDIGLQHTLQALGVTYLSKPASRRGLGEAIKDAARKMVKLNVDGPSRLLIAEDTDSVRDILGRQLDKVGVEADFVVNGREALTALDTGQYGILFTDLHMPDMDGYALVEEIRKREAENNAMREVGTSQTHFPVIVLTADVQMAQRQVYLSHGFDECLLKPVSLGQFRRLLIRWGLLTATEEEEAEEAAVVVAETPPVAVDDNLPPAIDLNAVKAQMGALDAGTIEMLGMFADMTAPLIAKIRETMDHADYPALREAAHSLKGGARSACCVVLGDIAAQLQDDADQRKPSCLDLVHKIEVEFERVKHAVVELGSEGKS